MSVNTEVLRLTYRDMVAARAGENGYFLPPLSVPPADPSVALTVETALYEAAASVTRAPHLAAKGVR
ncbi:hypothetical protein OG440_38880 (plasmid) [Streptomyces sp. NBC_00637]|jgi:hypothetical protein|uniref:hypothetical protein n=1 Tax=Streptomyces sp. NBC_00637 TaxID=2903667 RepID=UPI002F919530